MGCPYIGLFSFNVVGCDWWPRGIQSISLSSCGNLAALILEFRFIFSYYVKYYQYY